MASSAFVDTAARATFLVTTPSSRTHPTALSRRQGLPIRAGRPQLRMMAAAPPAPAAAAGPPSADYPSESDGLISMRSNGSSLSSAGAAPFGRNVNTHHLARPATRRVVRVVRKKSPVLVSASTVSGAGAAPRRIRVRRSKITQTSVASSRASGDVAASAAAAAAASSSSPASAPAPVFVPASASAPAPETKVNAKVSKESGDSAEATPAGTTTSKDAAPAPDAVKIPVKASSTSTKEGSTSSDPVSSDKSGARKDPPAKRFNVLQALEFSFVATGACVVSYASVLLTAGFASIFTG